MTDAYLSKDWQPHETSQEKQPEFEQQRLNEYTDDTPNDEDIQVETSLVTALEVETGEVVESRFQKVRKTMCVTTVSSLMVIAWAAALTLFSVGGYWITSTMPLFHSSFSYKELIYYPMTAALVVSFLLSPVFAVAGDVRFGNFRVLLAGVIPLNVAGLILTGVLLAIGFLVIPILFPLAVVGYLALYLAVAAFQANAIQFGRDVLGDVNSPERSSFVHWYYWAMHVPVFLTSAPFLSFLIDSEGQLIFPGIIFSSIAIFMLLLVFVVTFTIHCVRWATGKMVIQPRITKNPVTLVFKVTRYALQHPSNSNHHGILARLNNTKQSKGGPVEDEDVESVIKFWSLAILMVTLVGFLFWDDMWAVSLMNGINEGLDLDNEHLFTSSQVTTSAVVVICVPIYQLVIRPFLGKHSFPLLWRISIGLIVQLISLAFVTWSSEVTTSRIGLELVSDICAYISSDDGSVSFDAQSFTWYVLIIPQVINGFSQLLVFPAVIELILTDAPRVMHGLLIGIWYAMQSFHFILGIIETATCATLYWPYYLMKIGMVLLSFILFGAAAFFYKRNQITCSGHVTPMEERNEVVPCREDNV